MSMPKTEEELSEEGAVSFDVWTELEDHFKTRKIWEMDRTIHQAVWGILSSFWKYRFVVD